MVWIAGPPMFSRLMTRRTRMRPGDGDGRLSDEGHSRWTLVEGAKAVIQATDGRAAGSGCDPSL